MPYLRQVFDFEESCISYFICCPNKMKAVVVDPNKDWRKYAAMAQSESCEITHVIDTHIHSDHLSGAQLLARETGAELCMHASADVEFRYTALSDGENINVGNASLQVIETPGHTTESISLSYRDAYRGSAPWGILTGDSLFVGDVGRQDLIGAGTIEQMHDSIFKKLLSYQDYVEVYPAHYAGSKCGSGDLMSFKSVSTIGFERRMNPMLKATTLPDFARLIGAKRRPMPHWFAEIKRLNKTTELSG